MRIRTLFKTGHRLSCMPLSVYYMPYPVPETCHQVLFRVPKKTHSLSTTRHLLVRRMREAYRHHKHQLESCAIRKCFVLLAYVYVESSVCPYSVIEHQLITSLMHIKRSVR